MNKCCVFWNLAKSYQAFLCFGVCHYSVSGGIIWLRFVDLGQARYSAELKHSCLGNGPFYVKDWGTPTNNNGQQPAPAPPPPQQPLPSSSPLIICAYLLSFLLLAPWFLIFIFILTKTNNNNNNDDHKGFVLHTSLSKNFNNEVAAMGKAVRWTLDVGLVTSPSKRQ